MQVPDDIVNEWLELKEWRDTQRIAKIIGIAPQNVSVILHTGKGTVKQIAEIVKYFEPRKKLKAKLIDDLN